MYEIFSKLLQSNNETPYKVSKDTGVSQSTLSDWKLGKITPKSDTLKKLADHFGVSVDYLMTGKENEGEEAYYLNDETARIAQRIYEDKDMRTLFDMSSKMTPDRLKAHIEFMKKLQESENQ